MGRKRETWQLLIKSFREWITDTPLRIWGWIVALIALVTGSVIAAIWLQDHFPPWYVWLGFVLAILGVIWLSFLPYYRRIKIRHVQVVVLSAYQSKNPSRRDHHINFDIEFNVRIKSPPASIARIQMLIENEFLETNSPIVPMLQTNELESYAANVDVDYYLYLESVLRGREHYRLCILTSGSKWISNEFSFGNSSTLLMRNKPDGFNLVID